MIVLYGAAALFAVSGIVALPSGNITGGVGCLVIAAVCAFFGKKSGGNTAEGKTAPAAAPAYSTPAVRIAETIRTKVVGVTYNNDDGENRQDILSSMTGDEKIEVEKTTYNGEPDAYVKWGSKVLGYLSAELAKDLAERYPKARYTAEILEISGGGYIRSGAISSLTLL